jgi:hypothetical protein
MPNFNPDSYSPGREQVQVTAAPIIQSEKARFDPEGSANKLLEALGTTGTQQELARFNQQYEENKLREQTAKIGWYTEQFQKDHEGGAVSQAQIKARFPETVPIIAARIAENIGAVEGQKRWQGVVDDINADDNLRLDTNARNAFIAQKRAEIVSQIQPGNDFYGNGVVSSIDKLIAQHAINWETQTAQYHEAVQGEAFSKEVVNALNGGQDPGAALLALDANWSKSSSLNNLERNKLVVKTAIDTAFTNDDPKVFQMVPSQFLNADSKAALEKARVQLVDRRMSDWRNAQALKTAKREEDTRAAKTQIVNDVADGKPVDPAMYRNDPDQFQFAIAMREVPRIDESTSVANMQSFRNQILNSATDMRGTAPSLQNLTDAVLHHPTMNPKEKKQLLEDLPKLIDGRTIMSDEAVREPLTSILNPALQQLQASTSQDIASISGRSLRGEATQAYMLDVKRGMQAYFEDHGDWPVGQAKRTIIDGAVDRASKLIEKMTSINYVKEISDQQKAQKAAAPAATAQAAIDAAVAAATKGKTAAPSPVPGSAPQGMIPGTNTPLPKGVTLISK